MSLARGKTGHPCLLERLDTHVFGTQGCGCLVFHHLYKCQKFYDYEDCPRGDIANGGFAIGSGGGAVGIGFSCNKITFGSLFSKSSCGWSVGIDLGAAVLAGASFVNEVESTPCCSEN